MIHCDKLDNCGGRNLQAFEDYIDGLRIPVRIVHTTNAGEDFVSDMVNPMLKTFQKALVGDFDNSPYTNKSLTSKEAFIFAPIQEIDHFI